MSPVVRLVRKEKLIELDESKFFEFLKMAFHQKRKTLKNNLQGYNWDRIAPILQNSGYSLSARAEEISYETFVLIFQNL